MHIKTQFSDLKLGAVFFDPLSGDYWTKVSDTHAEHLEGEEGQDEFQQSDIVELVTIGF